MAANPNTIPLKTVFDKEYQITHHKVPVYPAISNFRLAAQLEKGDVITRDYTNDNFVAQDMGGDGSYLRQPIVDVEESLTINKEKEVSFYVKDLDVLQSHLPLMQKRAQDQMAVLFNQIDGDVLGQYDQFTLDVDNADFGGSASDGITVDETNVQQLFTKSKKKLMRQNRLIDEVAQFSGVRRQDKVKRYGVAVISPDVYESLLLSVGGRETVFGDKVLMNGHAGRYLGFDIFVSNAVGWSATLQLATQPTDADTVVINGVTLTFKTTLGTTAGNMLIGATAATANDALVACVNDSESLSAAAGGAGASTVGTLYVELTLANRNLLRNITATDGTTKTTFKAVGFGFISVSETLTAAADIWTGALQIQHCLLGINAAIDIVIRLTPRQKIKSRDGKVGDDVVTWTVYGIKVFQEHLKSMVDVSVRTSAYL